MRKRRIRNKVAIMSISIVFSILFLLGIGYAALNQRINIIGKASRNENVKKDVIIWIETTYEDGLFHYKLTITVTNNLKYNLYGWTLQVDTPMDTKIVDKNKINTKIKGNKIDLSSTPENHELNINESQTFYYEITSTYQNYKPNNVKLNKETVEYEIIEMKSEQPKVNKELKALNSHIQKVSTWEEEENYFHEYEIYLKNDNNIATNFWNLQLAFSKQGEITKIWNATKEEVKPEIYTIKNTEFNGIINAKSNIHFGLIYQSKEKEVEISVQEINSK